MKVLQLRRARVVKLTLSALLVLFVIHLIYTWTRTGSGKGHFYSKGFSESLKQKRSVQRPVLISNDQLGNFEPRNEEKHDGPGEGGAPHYVGAAKENEVSQSVSEYGMNIVCSDEISLDRSIPDTRLPECKHWDYPEDLPKASVVIVFHNEGWSVLLRTVHTVINRSPPQFLEEILLVDDFSDKEHLKGRLDSYIRRFQGKVRLIRNTERQGLIRTRTYGAEQAKGEVILFLDAHCEVNQNWLPPLLAPIARDRRTMTVPVIDGVDHNTFEYRPVYQNHQHFRGIFEWGMLYKETEIPPAEMSRRKHKSEPYKSPTHAGGLFAIDREYFLELGAYDPGLLVWGGENFELSFKIWQCGGSIEWVPCSRVGHVYRGFMPYTFGKLASKKKGPLITINYKRVIEVWFDEKYKKYFYTREPMAKYLEMGDISKQLEMKERLQCKSFQWFMENVAYDMPLKFPELPPNLQVGGLTNVATKQCLDTMGHAAPSLMGVSSCHGYGNNQLVRLNAEGQIGIGERCVEADRQGIKLVFCRLGTVDGPWKYSETDRTLYNKQHKKCLALHPKNKVLVLLECDVNNSFQQWVFQEAKPGW